MRSLFGLACFTLLTAASAVGCTAPAVVTPDEIVAAFIAASQEDARTMHMEWQGTIHTTQQTDEPAMPASDATITATFEFSGPDYEGVITTSSGGDFGSSRSTVSYAQVGGAYFTRYETGGWQRLDGGGGLAVTPLAFDPLTGLTAAGVTYEGPETIGGRQVHRLRVADPLGMLEQTLFPVGGFGEIGLVEGGASDYVVFVDARGIPVSARLQVDVRVQMMIDRDGGGAEAQYQMTSDYQFSDWGAEIFIIAPQVVDQGFPRPGIEDKPQF